MFGTNENLIFVVAGDPDSVITLFDDTSGTPVRLWQIYMPGVASTNRLHVLSNLKQSVSPGLDMIAFAHGYATFCYGKITLANTSPFAISNYLAKKDSVNPMGTNEMRGVYIKNIDVILVGILDTASG